MVAHEGSNKEKNTHLVPENSGRKLGVVAREGVVLRCSTVNLKKIAGNIVYPTKVGKLTSLGDSFKGFYCISPNIKRFR